MITVFGPQVTMGDLRTIEPVAPAGAGRRWKPIHHDELVDTIRDEVSSRGWNIEKEMFSTARDGADMAGALVLGKATGIPDLPGMNLSLGFLNSNARRKALQITVGAQVTCCCNGMCTGNIILSRMHDHTVNLIEEVEAAVDRYAIAAQAVPDVVAGLRQRELAKGEAAYILLQAGRLKLVGWAAIGRIDSEYHNPTFAEHGKNTSWALLNAFTYAARKNIAATRQMETYNTFRELLPTVRVA